MAITGTLLKSSSTLEAPALQNMPIWRPDVLTSLSYKLYMYPGRGPVARGAHDDVERESKESRNGVFELGRRRRLRRAGENV
jgi:hypothetical protein